MSVLAVQALNQSYGGSHTLWDVESHGARRFAHLPHGPQRHGKDHAAQVHHGAAAGDVGGEMSFGATDLPEGPGGRPGAARHRLRAAGT